MKQNKTKSRSKQHLHGVKEVEEGGEDEGEEGEEEEEGEEVEEGEEEEVEEEHRLPLGLHRSCSLQKVNYLKLCQRFKIPLPTSQRRRPEK